MIQLGLSLVKDKILSRAQLDMVLAGALRSGRGMVQVLVEDNIVDDKFLANYLSKTYHYQLVSEEDALSLLDNKPNFNTLPRDVMHSVGCVYLGEQKNHRQVLLADPFERPELSELKFLIGEPIDFYVTNYSAIKQLLQRTQDQKQNVKPPSKPAMDQKKVSMETSKDEIFFNLARDKIRNAENREQLIRGLLSYGEKLLDRVALFLVRKQMAIGWEGQGAGIQGVRIRGVIVPFSSPSVFSKVHQEYRFYCGPPNVELVDRAFLCAMGGIEPQTIVVIPMIIGGKQIAFFYGDTLLGEFPKNSLNQLNQLVREASASMQRLIFQKKRSRG